MLDHIIEFVEYILNYVFNLPNNDYVFNIIDYVKATHTILSIFSMFCEKIKLGGPLFFFFFLVIFLPKHITFGGGSTYFHFLLTISVLFFLYQTKCKYIHFVDQKKKTLINICSLKKN